MAQQNSFVAQITTQLFCCGNKILVGQAKPFSQCAYCNKCSNKKNSTYKYIFIVLYVSL